MDFIDLTIKSAAELIAHKKVSAKELAEMSLKRIKEVDDKLHAFLYVAEKESLVQAQNVDEMVIAEGENFSLTGIPYALKDNILYKGMQATAASKILEGYKATYNPTILKKLNKQPPATMAKPNLHQL